MKFQKLQIISVKDK